ncbi:MAG: hypothetical protein PVF29_01480 [Desulfobacterales bacterium]|jgi:hypothetical protein
MIEIVVLFAATAVLAGILLSFVEALWYLYLQTHVGMKFTADPSRSSVHLLTQLIQKDLFLLPVDVATSAIAACLIVSAICQLLALRRYFYEGHGLLNRFIWLALFGAAAAYILERNSGVDIKLAFGVVIAPCLCLLSSCQNIAKRLLPELTPFALMDQIRRIKNARRHSEDRAMVMPPAPLYATGQTRFYTPPASRTPLSAKPRRTQAASPRTTSQKLA